MGFVALNFGVLALLTHASALMYSQGVPFEQISLVLGAGESFLPADLPPCLAPLALTDFALSVQWT